MDSETNPNKPAKISPETVGSQSSTIAVELSTRFLEHFSEQLYSSPQKAFEELISNGWDAGADCVDIRVPNDLSDCLKSQDHGWRRSASRSRRYSC